MLGEYSAYIIPSYVITALVIGALTGWIMIVYRQRKREIAALEARGITRRSAAKTGSEKQSGGKNE